MGRTATWLMRLKSRLKSLSGPHATCRARDVSS